MKMRSHLHRQVNRKVSDFIVGEAGKVGSQSAFTAAAFIGVTSLAGILLGAPDASAVNNCVDANCNDDSPWCCFCWAEGYCGGEVGEYNCQDENLGAKFPGISCWEVD